MQIYNNTIPAYTPQPTPNDFPVVEVVVGIVSLVGITIFATYFLRKQK